MDDLPTFFFSYERGTREGPGNYLIHFYNQLQLRLADLAEVSSEERTLGTVDWGVPQANDWDEELSRGLGENRAFLAIITPSYFKRPNCGKELMAFLQRSPRLGLNQDGVLTGVKNIVVIRWRPERFYANLGVKNSRIPPILRLIQNAPANKESDELTAQAIKLYQKNGMESCVDRREFVVLLNLFAELIYDMQDLPPPIKRISFAATDNAFEYDWKKHFGLIDSSEDPAPLTASIRPQALSSVLAFYVTNRPFTTAPVEIDFAGRLIAEPLPGDSTSIDPGLAVLLADVRAAGVDETLTVYHAAAGPVLPVSSDALVKRLASLSSKDILTALIVDPDIWPGGAEDATVEQILRSPDWAGPALVAAMNARITDDLEKKWLRAACPGKWPSCRSHPMNGLPSCGTPSLLRVGMRFAQALNSRLTPSACRCRAALPGSAGSKMPPEPGRIYTFYSYKGGTGRSMVLANFAWIMAASGKRVLAVDWDLEAPGLHRYFRPFLTDPDLFETDGLIDTFWSLAASLANKPPGENGPEVLDDDAESAIEDTKRQLQWKFPTGGFIDFVGAGRQGTTYSERVNTFDWKRFYALGGAKKLTAMKTQLKAGYDWVLIDSRTGVSDTAGICNAAARRGGRVLHAKSSKH